MVEEFDSASAPPDPAAYPGEVLLKTYAAIPRALAARGVDRRYGRLLLDDSAIWDSRRLVRRRGRSWRTENARERTRPGDMRAPPAGHDRCGRNQRSGVRRQHGASGSDPDFLMPSAALWAVWGRRP